MHPMNDSSSDLQTLVQSAQAAFDAATSPADLENAKARFLGKSGSVTELLKGMAALSPEEKKTRGAAINQAKQQVEALLNERRQSLADAELAQQLRAESLDVTLPGRRRGEGGLHPVSLSIERIEGIFGSMGFDVADGPEIEADWYNFTALNTPEDHPARSMHDTFYVEGGHLLRTHTSPMQVRYAVQHVKRHAELLAKGERMPEIRVIAPGRPTTSFGLAKKRRDGKYLYMNHEAHQPHGHGTMFTGACAVAFAQVSFASPPPQLFAATLQPALLWGCPETHRLTG